MTTAYRPEIDGLRTIAVLGVLLFHLKIGMFKGGFAGVDVFFVISGYLITGRILGDAGAGRFSFPEFYIRRARRILPALIFTVAVTFVAGLLWLPPESLRGLAKESTHALLSIANIQYWREAKEYFATASDQLPLLHFWSLSLEEQFYLVWPLFVVAAVRLRKQAAAIAVAGLLSFALAVFWNARDPQAVFFLMPFRIFQFAIGAAVWMIEARRRPGRAASEALSLAGLIAIGISYVVLDERSSVPVMMLTASLGAAGVILGADRSVASRLLTNAPALAIGRASYSLYLCHWPIIFFAGVIFGAASETAAGIAISFVLMVAVGFFMWRFIEQPFRRPAVARTPRATALRFASLIAVLVAITHGTFLANGLAWRLTAAQREEARILGRGGIVCLNSEGPCAFGDVAAPLAVDLVGDSFAEQYVDGLGGLLKEWGMRGELSSDGGCPLLDGIVLDRKDWKWQRCRDSAGRALTKLRQTSTAVIISQAWSNYRNGNLQPGDEPSPSEGGPYSQVQRGIERTIRQLGDNRIILIVGAQVIMTQCTFNAARMLPAPLPHASVTCEPKSRAEAVREGAEINAMLRNVQRQWPDRVRLLFPTDVYCENDRCPAMRDGVWLYRDTAHYTVAGSLYMGERARSVFADFLGR